MAESDGTALALASSPTDRPVATDVGGGLRRAPLEWNSEQIAIIKDTVAKGLSDPQFGFFLETCARVQLDPFKKQIYGIVRGGRLTIQTGIDGYRTIADRTGLYQGQDDPMWCGADGVWKDVWLEKGPPMAAKVSVHRHGFRKPMTAVAHWSEYGSNTGQWPKMPALMLSKCAEALALRKAFPDDLAGVYTREEMDQDGAPIEVEAEVVDEYRESKSQKSRGELAQENARVRNEEAETLKRWLGELKAIVEGDDHKAGGELLLAWVRENAIPITYATEGMKSKTWLALDKALKRFHEREVLLDIESRNQLRDIIDDVLKAEKEGQP